MTWEYPACRSIKLQGTVPTKFAASITRSSSRGLGRLLDIHQQVRFVGGASLFLKILAGVLVPAGESVGFLRRAQVKEGQWDALQINSKGNLRLLEALFVAGFYYRGSLWHWTWD